MLKITNAVALVVLVLIICTACKKSGHQGATLAKTASLERTAGSVAPAFYYEDTISLNGTTLTLTRTGGASVVAGTWSVKLAPVEVKRLNQALAIVTATADADSITPPPNFRIGGGIIEIVLGGTDTFLSGVITADGQHEFSADVQALYDLVIDIVSDQGLDFVYSASV